MMSWGRGPRPSSCAEDDSGWKILLGLWLWLWSVSQGGEADPGCTGRVGLQFFQVLDRAWPTCSLMVLFRWGHRDAFVRSNLWEVRIRGGFPSPEPVFSLPPALGGLPEEMDLK